MPSKSAPETRLVPTARPLIVLALLVAAFAAIACSGRPAPTPTEAPAAAAPTYPPIEIAVESGVYPQQTLEERTRAVPVVVAGTIIEVKPARWSTPNGARPASPDEARSAYTVFTDYVLAAEQWVKGGAGRRNLVVRAIGGQVGQDRVVVKDEPSFTTGERVLLMLRPGSQPQLLSTGGPYYMASPIGTFRIQAGDTVTAGGTTHKLDELLSRMKDWAEKRVLIESVGSLDYADDLVSLARASELIVSGTVQLSRPPRWSTSDRRTPPVAQKGRYLIFTDYIVRADGVLKAPAGSATAPGAELVVRVIGGTVESDTQLVPEEADLAIGERVLLLLKRDTLPETKEVAGPHYRVVNGHAGKWQIAGAQATRDLPGSVAEPLADLVRKIQEAVR